MATLAPVLRHRFLDANDNPLVGGKLYTYLAGTNTPKVTYVSKDGAANTNPIILDGQGYCDLWLGTGFYKFILKDSNDVTLWSVDQVAGGFTTASGDATFGSVEATTIIMNGVNLQQSVTKIYGSYTTPRVIDNALNPFPNLTTAQETKVFCVGLGGPVDVSAVNPQIPAGVLIGQRITLIGGGDINTITLGNGNGLYTGGATILLAEGSVWSFVWDGTRWVVESTNGL